MACKKCSKFYSTPSSPFQLSFLMYTSYFVLFGHFFYHAYLNPDTAAGGKGENGIQRRGVGDGVTIISAQTDESIVRSSELKNDEDGRISQRLRKYPNRLEQSVVLIFLKVFK